MMIYWTAHNDRNRMVGYRQANTLRGAVLAAREYADNELCQQEAVVEYYDSDPRATPEYTFPIRIDRRNIWTGYKWQAQIPGELP